MTTTLFGSLQNVLSSSFNLLFPVLCPACNEPLTSPKITLCLQCELDLPRTNHFALQNNIFFKQFELGQTFQSASGLFYFDRRTKVQHLIHQFKYHNKSELAISMGELLGIEIKNCAHLQNIKAIIPVPMHPKKLRERGYNQAELIAKGMANILNLPIETKVVKKVIETTSQTHRSRDERKSILIDTFESAYQKHLEDVEALVVDDVSTTGATLEAVGDCILQNNPKILLHCVTLAYTAI